MCYNTDVGRPRRPLPARAAAGQENQTDTGRPQGRRRRPKEVFCMEYEEITEQTKKALCELLEAANLKEGDLFVVGCSSSEVRGEHIGKGSSMEVAAAILQGIYPVLKERKIWLAAQCCEHLNRALILEEEAARAYGYEPVCVMPQPHAGGSWATNCWQAFEHPVAVERIQAAVQAIAKSGILG